MQFICAPGIAMSDHWDGDRPRSSHLLKKKVSVVSSPIVASGLALAG
jgi:hypothetical protein